MTISARQLGWWRTRVRSHWSMGSSSASSPSIWRSATPSSCRLAGGSATPASQARVAATAILLEAGQPVMEQGGGGRPDRGGVPRVHPTGLCRAHGSYASRFAEASRYAYEPRHSIDEPLDHHTGVGTGELTTRALYLRGGSSPSDYP